MAGLFVPSSLDSGLRTDPGEQIFHRNVQRFRGGLVFKAHKMLYHSTLGLRVMTKKKKDPGGEEEEAVCEETPTSVSKTLPSVSTTPLNTLNGVLTESNLDTISTVSGEWPS